MEMTRQTVVYLKGTQSIWLARKKKDIHDAKHSLEGSKNTWNGYGGSFDKEKDKDILATALRELKEESGVIADKADLMPCGRILFHWPKKEGRPDKVVEVFFFTILVDGVWVAEPREMKDEGGMGPPTRFEFKDIPYEEMMPGDRLFLPKMLKGKFVEASIYLGEKNPDGTLKIIETAQV